MKSQREFLHLSETALANALSSSEFLLAFREYDTLDTELHHLETLGLEVEAK